MPEDYESLGDSEELASELAELEGSADMGIEESEESSGFFSNLGPLSNTRPAMRLEEIDSPKLNGEYARKFAWRGVLKVQGEGDATAALDFIMAGVAGMFAMFKTPDNDEEEEAPGEDIEMNTIEDNE